MRKLDIRGIIQPFSFLTASIEFKEIPDNETLEIWLSSPEAVEDLVKILPASSCVILSIKEDKNKTGFRLQLKKIGCKGGNAKFNCQEIR